MNSTFLSVDVQFDRQTRARAVSPRHRLFPGVGGWIEANSSAADCARRSMASPEAVTEMMAPMCRKKVFVLSRALSWPSGKSHEPGREASAEVE